MAPARTILDELRDLAALIRDAGGAEVHMRDAETIRRAIAVHDTLLSLVKRFVALQSGAWYPYRHAAEEAELVTDALAALRLAEGK